MIYSTFWLVWFCSHILFKLHAQSYINKFCFSFRFTYPQSTRVYLSCHGMMSFRQKFLSTCRSFSSTSEKMAAPATVTLDNMNPCIKKMEYAVRGPLVIRATAIEKVFKSFDS